MNAQNGIQTSSQSGSNGIFDIFKKKNKSSENIQLKKSYLMKRIEKQTKDDKIKIANSIDSIILALAEGKPQNYYQQRINEIKDLFN